MEQGEGGGPVGRHTLNELRLVGDDDDAQIVGQFLQLATSAAHAGGAAAGVLGQDQLHVGAAGGTHTGGVGLDHHTLADRGVTGGHHGALALDLDTADAAGGDLVDVLQIAQVGNVDVDLAGSLQNGGTLRSAHMLTINDQIYHSVSLPPLKVP